MRAARALLEAENTFCAPATRRRRRPPRPQSQVPRPRLDHSLRWHRPRRGVRSPSQSMLAPPGPATAQHRRTVLVEVAVRARPPPALRRREPKNAAGSPSTTSHRWASVKPEASGCGSGSNGRKAVLRTINPGHTVLGSATSHRHEDLHRPPSRRPAAETSRPLRLCSQALMWRFYRHVSSCLVRVRARLGGRPGNRKVTLRFAGCRRGNEQQSERPDGVGGGSQRKVREIIETPAHVHRSRHQVREQRDSSRTVLLRRYRE